MFDQNKAGIVNSLGIVAGVKVSESSAKLMNAVVDKIGAVGVREVELTDIKNVEVEGKSLTDNQAVKIMAAIDFHKSVAVVKAREKKPTQLETYIAETSEEDRDDMAVRVAVLRINAEGTKPIAWRKIREHLGLKLDEFHKVIRLSDGWVRAVVGRIATLKLDNPDWAYSGKMDVLTGIDGFDMTIVNSFVEKLRQEKADEEAAEAAALEAEASEETTETVEDVVDKINDPDMD